MADVFNEAVSTATRSHGGTEDFNRLVGASLALGSVPTTTALAGTTGVYTLLVNGDVWEEIHGNETRHLTGNQTITIDSNRTETVKGNHRHTIVGTTTTKHIGVHNHTNVNHRNDTYLQTRLEDHSQPEQKHQPTQLMEIQKAVAEYTSKHTKFSSWFFTMVALKMDITPVLAMSFTTAEAKLGVLATKALLLEAISKSMDTKYQEATTNFTFSAILASAIWAKVIMFDGNAGVAGNLDSPFA